MNPRSILSGSFAVPDQWRGPLPRSEFDRDIWAGVCTACGLVHATGDSSPNAVRCERLNRERREPRPLTAEQIRGVE